MAFCSNCGNEIPSGVNFCTNCGASIPIKKVPNREEYGRRSHVSNKRQAGLYKFSKFFGIVLLILALIDYFSDPPILTVLLSVLIIGACIFCLAQKYKLKGFTIVALILSIICLLAGTAQGKRLGFLKTPDKIEPVEIAEDIIIAENPPEVVPEVQVEKKAEDQSEVMIAEPAEESETIEESIIEEDPAEPVDGVDPELKAFLDSYEEFMGEYVIFMKKYSDDPGNAIAMLGDYTKIMTKYAEFAEKIEQYDEKEMSTADAKYYLEVTTRCAQKMLDIYE